ncbi:MAG: hypothetical protein RL011_1109 [Pseudomonadota bacterium]|jgi:SM-20-related protein
MMSKIADDLATHGWATCANFLMDDEWRELVADVHRLKAANLMRPAGVGRASDYKLVSSVRSDLIYWLDESALTPAQEGAMARLEDLRQTLNRELFLGLRELEAHLTHFGPSGHYDKHVDNFQGQSSRILSCILYLNDGWQRADGGELRIYAADDPGRLVGEVEPRGGTLACFLSRDIPHEVATTTKERLSLTGWFR